MDTRTNSRERILWAKLRGRKFRRVLAYLRGGPRHNAKIVLPTADPFYLDTDTGTVYLMTGEPKFAKVKATHVFTESGLPTTWNFTVVMRAVVDEDLQMDILASMTRLQKEGDKERKL